MNSLTRKKAGGSASSFRDEDNHPLFDEAIEKYGKDDSDVNPEEFLFHVHESGFSGVVSYSLSFAGYIAKISGSGHKQGALRLARNIPLLLRDRRDAVSTTLHLSLADDSFLALVHAGDELRDEGRWSEGEFHYWKALQLYPFHRGYLVQYGHCLKEQDKFLDAEITYRDTLALGDLSDDLAAHLEYSMQKRGATLSKSIVDKISAFWNRSNKEDIPFAIPVTKQDIEDVFDVFTGRTNLDTLEIAELLSSASRRDDLISILIRSDEFAFANRDLLTFLHETGVLSS